MHDWTRRSPPLSRRWLRACSLAILSRAGRWTRRCRRRDRRGTRSTARRRRRRARTPRCSTPRCSTPSRGTSTRTSTPTTGRSAYRCAVAAVHLAFAHGLKALAARDFLRSRTQMHADTSCDAALADASGPSSCSIWYESTHADACVPAALAEVSSCCASTQLAASYCAKSE
eukprot:6190369-Pleurochrysis_carterae.AAC.3